MFDCQTTQLCSTRNELGNDNANIVSNDKNSLFSSLNNNRFVIDG